MTKKPTYEEPENPRLVDGKYSIRDLIDIGSLSKTLEKFYLATGFTTGFVEHPTQEILIATGWRDICTNFHRASPESAKNCKASNIYLTEQLKDLKELNIKPCENGLVDGATPIIIKGKHIASLITGQVLFEDPDIERFKKQAEIYGYDLDAYLEALSKVPVVSEDQFKNALSFLSELAVTIAQTVLNNLELKAKTEKLERKVIEKKLAQKELLESEKKYRLLMNNLPGFVYKGFKDWSVEFYDNRVELLTGYNMHKFNSRKIKWVDLIIPEDIEPAKQAFVQALKTDKSYVRDYRIKTTAGDIIWIQERGSIVCNADGDIEYVSGIFFDITKHKKSEDMLKIERERLSMLLETFPGFIYLQSPDYSVRYANRYFVEHFGDPKNKLCYELLWNRSQPCEPCPTFKVFDTKAPQVWEWSETPDGKIYMIHDFPFVDSDGSELVLVVGIDITERKQAEEALQESEKTARALLDTPADAILLMDTRGIILDVNETTTVRLGRSIDELVGLCVWDLLPQNVAESRKVFFDKVIESGKPIRFEDESQGMWLDNVVNPILDEEGKVIKFALLSHDITELKQFEEQLRQSHKMEAIGTLAGGIAHEFNNILGIIIGNTELAFSDVPEWNPAYDCLQEIRTASLRAKDVVRQILSFARKTPATRKPINIRTIVTESLKLIRATTPASIEISQEMLCESEMILANPTEINQILMNLCSNSAHAMADETGILEVKLETVALDVHTAAGHEDLKAGDYVKLTVKDTGRGIDLGIMDRIMDPYFTTKDVDQGLGMGLAVVSGLVKKHDGAINITSAVGKGTTAEVLFPVTQAKAVTEVQAYEGLPAGTERILVVDDEASIVRVVSRMLEQHGYQVVGITSSPEALRLFQTDPDQFDLVITDTAMPDMPGDRLAQELIKIRPEIPVILCTGHSDRIDEDQAKALGIRAYTLKPLDMEKFPKMVREILDKTRS